jgi:hypothetical protein
LRIQQGGVVEVPVSEPFAAFVKLRIDRPKLVQWLDSPVPRAVQWTDWRNMGGQYYTDDGVKDLRDFSDSEIAEKVTECDARLRNYRDNRSALQDILSTADMPQFKRASYRADTWEFIAGSLTYAENLAEFITFYSVVRAVETLLEDGDGGIALIHDFLHDLATDSAMRLGPGGRSEFMSSSEMSGAGDAFQEIADEMLRDSTAPPVLIDELDSLR